MGVNDWAIGGLAEPISELIGTISDGGRHEITFKIAVFTDGHFAGRMYDINCRNPHSHHRACYRNR
jgi:hypothetical protein